MYEKIILTVNLIFIIILIYLIGNTYYDHPLYDTNKTLESFTLQDNLDNYNTLMNKLNQLSTNINNATETATNYVEKHPIYDPLVSVTKYNDIASYNSFLKSKSAAAQFFVDQAIKEKRMQLLREEIDRLKLNPALPQISQNNDKYSIKNPYSGINLNVEPVNANKSLIYLNGKCMTYNDSGDYSLNNCNLADTSQHFNLNKILTVDDYNLAIDDSQSNFRITSDQFAPISGFTAVQPLNNNKECLTIINKNITIEPCNMTNLQRWNPSNNKLSC
jgi:hypothetical protein